MEVWPRIATMIEAGGSAALVSVVATRGSVPREAGAVMIVRPDGAFHGSIGGGTLEWQALARAQAMLARGDRVVRLMDQALGPDLGQCCGGHVTLAVEVFDRSDLDEVRALAAAERAGPILVETRRAGDRTSRRIVDDASSTAGARFGHGLESFGERPDTIALFGAGHVGRALVIALAALPFRVVWCDERPGAYPPVAPANVEIAAGPSLAVLARLPEGAQVLIMTHSHALDLDIVAAALGAERFAHVGLIGSATKRARFTRRLAELGLAPKRIADLRCPIGLAAIHGKEPAVIAASVAAECLIFRDARSIKQSSPAARRHPA